MVRQLKVVCLGGGTGLPSLLAGLKHNPWLELTAVVNMFDTGGSSGDLRDQFGILPPGDVLKCMVALANKEGFARRILLQRISNADHPGHTGGNVLLLGLEKVYKSLPAAIDALGQLLFIKGNVVPVTLDKSCLCALYMDGMVHKGETSVDLGIHEGKELAEIFLDPEVPASPAAIKAITEADAICVGPGSFYTSVLSNFLPIGIREAVANSKAPLIFITNLLREGKGMRKMTVESAVGTVEKYAGRSVDRVIVNSLWPNPKTNLAFSYMQEHKYPLGFTKDDNPDPRIIQAPLWLDPRIARHDSARLAEFVAAIVMDMTGFLQSQTALAGQPA